MNVIDKERLSAWKYNVTDEYKSRSVEEIKKDLRSKAHPFAVLMEHWKGDFNISTMIRNANAFNASQVFYIGRKRFDRRGTVGTHHYVDLNYLNDFEELMKLKEKYVFVGLDNNLDCCVPMETFEWPDNALMIFGEEGEGISPLLLKECAYCVNIPQYGSVRSLNVGTSSGIAMYDWIQKTYAIQNRRK